MPYFQANELLRNPEATLEELLTALQDLGVQYGYIAAMASQGLREDAEIDLVRLLVLIKSIKFKITQIVNYEN